MLLGTALAVTVLRCAVASAAGDAAGTLGAGGTATGDISRTDGETDRITLDLVAGTTLAVTFKATFHATVVLTDPDAAPVALGLTGSARQRGAVEIARSGSYQIAIASADGSQGPYKLVAKQTWPRVIEIGGSGTATVDFGMPAGGKLACSVVAAPGAAGSPEIAHLVDPDGLELLSTPVIVRGHAAKLPPTTASVGGTYHLTVAADGTSAWTGRIVRRVPHVPSVALRLANGLDTISFREDGVGSVFARHCARCHGWASSYAGVRGSAFGAIARMVSGKMPPGGGLSGAEIALVRAWISTGRHP